MRSAGNLRRFKARVFLREDSSVRIDLSQKRTNSFGATAYYGLMIHYNKLLLNEYLIMVASSELAFPL